MNRMKSSFFLFLAIFVLLVGCESHTVSHTDPNSTGPQGAQQPEKGTPNATPQSAQQAPNPVTTSSSPIVTETVPQWIAAKVAEPLHKEVNDLTEEDWSSIFTLELDPSDIPLSERDKSDTVDLSFLIKMKNLTRLTINNIHAKNLSFLTQLPKLMTLHIQDIEMGSMPDLSGLTHLQTLELINGGLKNIDFLKNTKNIEILNISQNSLSDLTPLQSLPKLEVLDIEQTEVKTIQPILSMQPLKILIASQNKIDDIDQLKTHREIHVIERQTEASYSERNSHATNVEITDNQAKDILKEIIPKAIDIIAGLFNGPASGIFKVDATKTIPGEKEFCLITGVRGNPKIDIKNLKSIADLKKVVEDVFTKDSAQKLFYNTYLETEDNRSLPLYKDYDGQLYVNTGNGGHGWAEDFLINTTKIISQKDHEVQVALVTTLFDNPEGIMDIKMKNENGKWFLQSGLVNDYEYRIN